MLSNQESYRTYFQNLSTSHKQISWFKSGDEEIVKLSGNKKMTGLGLWADEEEPVEIEDKRSDNFIGTHKASLYVMTPKRKSVDDIKSDEALTESIVRDIISKLLQDYAGGLIHTQFRKYRFGRTKEYSFNGSKYTCSRLDIFWEEPMDLRFDPSKWT